MLAYLLMGRERTLSVSVHEKPNPSADRISRAEELAFIKDGFDWGAFVMPPLFFVQHGIWLGLAIHGLVALLIVAAFVLLDLPAYAAFLAAIGLNALVASEADEIRRAKLTHDGWSMVGQVTGTGMLDCERRFLDGWLPRTPIGAHGGQSGAGDRRGGSDAAGDGTSVPTSGQATGNGRKVLGNLLTPWKRT